MGEVFKYIFDTKASCQIHNICGVLGILVNGHDLLEKTNFFADGPVSVQIFNWDHHKLSFLSNLIIVINPNVVLTKMWF